MASWYFSRKAAILPPPVLRNHLNKDHPLPPANASRCKMAGNQAQTSAVHLQDDSSSATSGMEDFREACSSGSHLTSHEHEGICTPHLIKF